MLPTYESSDTIWPVQKKYTDDSTKTPTLANTTTVYVHERKFPKNVRDATFESSTYVDLSTFSISSEKNFSCDSQQQESSHVQVDVGNFCLADDFLDDENNINSNITKIESCIDLESNMSDDNEGYLI